MLSFCKLIFLLLETFHLSLVIVFVKYTPASSKSPVELSFWACIAFAAANIHQTKTCLYHTVVFVIFCFWVFSSTLQSCPSRVIRKVYLAFQRVQIVYFNRYLLFVFRKFNLSLEVFFSLVYLYRNLIGLSFTSFLSF